MYLTTLAFLQTLQLPEQAVFLNATHGNYGESYWQCPDVLNYSHEELSSKCPRIMPELNACCALWNDCSATNGQNCTEQMYECSKIVLTTSNAHNFAQCSGFPKAIKSHYATHHRQFLPTWKLFMKHEDKVLSEIYQKCPSKQWTLSTCVYNYKTTRYLSSRVLDNVDDVLKQFDLRVCMEMHLEDGEHCRASVDSYLETLNESQQYENVLANIEDAWKCGANRFEKYVTQVIVGQKCFWLKEAFNTCCKFTNKCLEEGKDQGECFSGWDTCNQAVITNSDYTIAHECIPFTSWVKNEQALQNELISAPITSYNMLWIVIGAAVVLFVLTALLICYTAKLRPNYQKYVSEEKVYKPQEL